MVNLEIEVSLMSLRIGYLLIRSQIIAWLANTGLKVFQEILADL